jgi:hypothetical protein
MTSRIKNIVSKAKKTTEFSVLNRFNIGTFVMEQTHSWEADNRLTGHKFLTFSFWNPKVCYCVYKITVLDPVLSQLNPSGSVLL